MRTAASEHLNHAQVMSRLGGTFSALIHEQIEIVRRYLDEEQANEAGELRSIAELSVRLVERSAEWLQVGDVASLALEIREAMAQLGQLRPAQRQELLAQCRVALEMEERIADRLRADGFASLVDHAEQVTEAIDRLRANLSQARSQARGMIDAEGPEIGAQENLLALTFEIKNALIHQNERICAMNEQIDTALRSSQVALSDWEGILKSVERQRMIGAPPETLADGKPLAIHQRLQDVDSGLHALAHEVTQLLGLQYSLERRARDLDEHLLWEFLDPLDRYVDELYAAMARGCGGRNGVRLAVQTGGVGFEAEVGSILLPLLSRVLETATPREGAGGESEIRFTGAREGLEARVEIEGPIEFEEEALRLMENALENLGGFATVRGQENGRATLQVQFPMARSLRSFLIVEAAGQRLALPWSAIERIYASHDDVPRGRGADSDGAAAAAIHPLAALFRPDAPPRRGSILAEDENREPEGALAVLRCGSGSAVVAFDRIVWRENARLRPMPTRLGPVDEILGGIVAPDSSITLVLNPAALLRRIVEAHGVPAGGAA